MSIKPRVRVPSPIKAGDVIEIKTLVNHVMETGQRRSPDGQVIARNIIHTFVASFEGRELFKADINSGISANPYLAFHMRAQTSGELVLSWTDDSGETVVEKITVTVG